ncbi:hypothetical protein PP101_07 [Pectobacterium phage PP101]|uniref:Uncharacterized protein n=1 Tax=Pectobacterium phage PP101 TaxID=1916414 RepID=A0A1J0MF51_9CAUD|nr:hypothetical protein HOR42_gp07 [Pectobacterium phage PP101]APD19673.1 hypothetical protein PP101_07 [Pectobacterium phage PP101]
MHYYETLERKDLFYRIHGAFLFYWTGTVWAPSMRSIMSFTQSTNKVLIGKNFKIRPAQ